MLPRRNHKREKKTRPETKGQKPEIRGEKARGQRLDLLEIRV